MVGIRPSMQLTVPLKSRTSRLSALSSASTVTSDWGVAHHARDKPSSRLWSINGKFDASPWLTSPSRIWTLGVARTRRTIAWPNPCVSSRVQAEYVSLLVMVLQIGVTGLKFRTCKALNRMEKSKRNDAPPSTPPSHKAKRQSFGIGVLLCLLHLRTHKKASHKDWLFADASAQIRRRTSASSRLPSYPC